MQLVNKKVSPILLQIYYLHIFVKKMVHSVQEKKMHQYISNKSNAFQFDRKNVSLMREQASPSLLLEKFGQKKLKLWTTFEYITRF